MHDEIYVAEGVDLTEEELKKLHNNDSFGSNDGSISTLSLGPVNGNRRYSVIELA